MPENKEKAKRPRGTGSVFQMKGSAVYWIKYYRDGKPVRESSGSDKVKTAENLLKQRIGELAVGKWIAPTDRKVTIDELYEGLLTNYRNNNRASLEGIQYAWEWKEKPGRIKRFFSGRRALSITTAILEKYVSECREQGLSNGTINRDMAALQRAFNLAYDCSPRKIQEVPTFPERLKESAARKGFLKDGEFELLKQNIKGVKELWLRAIIQIGYEFGWRLHELTEDRRRGKPGLRLRNVDFKANTLTLDPGTTKNDEGRLVYMTQEIRQLLLACCEGKKNPEDHVFTRPDGSPVIDFRERWKSLTAASGVPELHFHDFRRTAARNLDRAGVGRRRAMKITGHKTESMYNRYNIVEDADIAESIQRYEIAKRVWAENGQSLEPEKEAEARAHSATRYN